MLDAELIQKLQNAATVIMSPLDSGVAMSRPEAEEVIMDFKKTQNPFAMCRSILESVQHPYVLFETLNLMKDAVLREWKGLPAGAVTELRTYLLNYAMSRTQLPDFVKDRAILTVALVVKRQYVENELECETVLSDVKQLIQSMNPNMQLLGFSFMMALLQEHSGTITCSDMLLTWEQHFNAKKCFENKNLKPMFEFCLQALFELERISFSKTLVTNSPVILENSHEMLMFSRLMTITEHILCWNFTYFIRSEHLMAMFEFSQSSSFRPSRSWKELVRNPDVPALFFRLFDRVQTNERLTTLCVNCLLQFVSLNGVTLPDKDARTEYSLQLLKQLLPVVRSVNKSPCRLQICSLLNRFIMFFPLFTSCARDADAENLVGVFINELVAATCFLCEAMFDEEKRQSDDGIESEALGKLLDTWVSILQDPSVDSACSSAGTTQPRMDFSSLGFIIDTYLNTHLYPPLGKKSLVLDTADNKEESDRVVYSDQLTAIGFLARKILPTAIDKVAERLENCTQRLQMCLQQLFSTHQQQTTASPRLGNNTGASTLNISGEQSSVLCRLYEDLHWLLMVTGHIVTLNIRSEIAVVLEEVNRFSMSFRQQPDKSADPEVIQRTQEAIGLTVTQPMQKLPDESAVDPVVRLICRGFRVLELLRLALRANMSSVLSPELFSTALWFAHRISLTYLMMNNDFRDNISPYILSAFGAESESAQSMVGYLLGVICDVLTGLSCEENCLIEAVHLVDALCRSKNGGAHAIKCEHLNTITCLVTQQQLPIPANVHKMYLSALVIVGESVADCSLTKEYTERLIMPIRNSFVNFLQSSNFSTCSFTESTQKNVCWYLESFIGIVQGYRTSAVGSSEIILDLLSDTLKLMNLYKDKCRVVFELCLELFSESAKWLLYFLHQKDCSRFYELTLHMLDIFSNYYHQSLPPSIGAAAQSPGMLTRRAQKQEEEEDCYNDLILVMDVLSSVLTKNIVIISPLLPPISVANDDHSCEITDLDVVLRGLHIVSSMDADVLKCPDVCVKYYNLIALLAEIFPRQILELPDNLLGSLLASVRVGLTDYSSEVTNFCLEFLSRLAVCGCSVDPHRAPTSPASPLAAQQSVAHSAATQQRVQLLLCPFLQLLLEAIVTCRMNRDVIQASACTVFSLICCVPAEFSQLVGRLSTGNAPFDQRLAAAFQRLTEAPLELKLDRLNRIMFRDRFKEFVVELRSFMSIK